MNDIAPSPTNKDLPREADLVDAALALLAHRWLALGVFLLCLVIGILWAVLAPAHYQYSAAMKIAGLKAATGMAPVNSPQQIEAEMYAFYIPAIQSRYPPGARPKIVVQIPASTNLVIVSTFLPASETSKAQVILKDVISQASRADNQLLFSYVEQTKKYLNQQLKELTARLAKIEQTATANLKGPNTVAAGVYLSSQAGALSNRIAALREERDVSLTANIQPAGFGPEVVRSNQPVDLAAWARILIGGLVGVALGLFAALVAQFWQTACERSRMRVRE
ncbi:MAG: hypothetical protein ACRES7_07960 [Gammaproteobacteria bacterium]